jgi:hypothetical protein
LEISIFGRPIKNSPLNFNVSGSHNPIWRLGDPQLALNQPVRVEIGLDDGRLFVLDTGNNRLLILTNDGTVLRQIKDTDGKSGMLKKGDLICRLKVPDPTYWLEICYPPQPMDSNTFTHPILNP